MLTSKLDGWEAKAGSGVKQYAFLDAYLDLTTPSIIFWLCSLDSPPAANLQDHRFGLAVLAAGLRQPIFETYAALP